MPQFYHELITEKSFKILLQLKKELNFILIGGWAVFFYTNSLKSKDVNLIIDYDELGKIKESYDVFKNDNLKKYEIKIDNVDVDTYLPYFSDLGLPIEEIKKYTQSIQGFTVPFPEVLLILKTVTYNNRKGSSKGQKDLIDIFSLLTKIDLDRQRYLKIIKDNHLQDVDESFRQLVRDAKPLKEIDLKNHKLAKLKKEVLSNLE